MLPSTVTRVLIVDDSATVLAVHQSILEDAGFTCETAASGSEAYEMLLKEPYSLLVTDLNMPKMDGYELVRRLRAANIDLPVVMVTTEQESADKARGLEVGVDLFLVKPVEPEDFVQQCQMLAAAES